MRVREKLYDQMMEFPHDLPKPNHDKLLLHLKTEERNGRIHLKQYSEFLNMFNTLVFFYSCGRTLYKNPYHIIHFIFIDFMMLVYALLYFFLIRYKKVLKVNSHFIFILSFIGILTSISFPIKPQQINENYFKLNYLSNNNILIVK